MDKYSISLSLETIAWIAKIIILVKEQYEEDVTRFKKIDSGEYGKPEEYGYKSKDEFLEKFLKFTEESEVSIKCAKEFMETAIIELHEYKNIDSLD